MGRAQGPLAGILDYLHDLGWDGLYLAKPSKRSSAAEPRGPSQEPPRPSKTLQAAAPVRETPATRAPPAADLAAVALEASACTRCRLAEGRRTVVFGSGDPQADLMFIGEAPGFEEDRQGQPFVGPAGALLSKIIAAIDLRREDVYIANVVKCRPPNNRDPLPDEVAACRRYLERQIDAVRPKLLVILGRVAAQNLLRSDQSLGSMRGRWHEVRGIPTRVTYHPAALLRQVSYKRPTWDDMKLVRDRLGAPREA